MFNNAEVRIDGEYLYINGDAIKFSNEDKAREFLLELTKRLIEDR